MITTSALYNSIFAGQHSVEWKITVNGTIYGMDKISATVGGGNARPHLHRQLFSAQSPATGACVSSTFECSIFEASANVPRMATVVPAYRIKNAAQTSEWVALGTFYIDTRAVDKATGVLTLTCYDRMLVADGVDGKSYADVTSFTTWPQSMSAVATEIATIMGVTIDARTNINTGTGYMVQYPNDLTMREVLGYIGVAHAGCWTITPNNKLRLIPITGGTDTINLGVNTKKLSSAIPFSAWSGVTVYYEDEAAYQAGDDTGRVMVCDCPWATQDTANGILSVIDNVAYRPFSTGVAYINLAAELGDIVTVGLPGETVTAPLFTLDIVAETVEAATVSAEGEEEIDHEYPYSDYVDRSLKRKVTLGQSYYGTSISRNKGLEIVKTNGVTEQAKVTLNADEMVFEDTNGDPVLYFDAEQGTFVFDGILGASALYTDSLYAEQGDVADLTVNRLDTGNYISRYLSRNISDLNHIKISQDSYGMPHVYLMTSAVKRAYASADGYERLTNSNGVNLYWTDELMTSTTTDATAYPAYIAVTTLTNPYGEAVYWSQDISGATITDGYPYVDGVRIYTTTDDTGYPVIVWEYESQPKIDLTFMQGTSGYYEPRIVLGAGDAYGTSKGYIYKGQNGLDIIYDRSDAAGELSLHLSDTGYIKKTLSNNGYTATGNVEGNLSYEDLYVSSSDWSLEDPPTFAQYPYAATIPCYGATPDMGGEVIFSPDDVVSGKLASAARSGVGTLTVFAKTPISATILRVDLRF